MYEVGVFAGDTGVLVCSMSATKGGLEEQSAQLSISAAPGLLLALLCPSAHAHARVSPRQQRAGSPWQDSAQD